ncbi:MAG: hypothetical protein IT168_09355 [Bryobacterales bacterium]|nr:hypothetical protein [Bryobacterales bacterium]
MTTERKRQAARANGAKSRGPVTAAGKAQSSQNAVKHGLTSAVTILLPGESEDQFRREHADLACTLQPVNDAEAKLVEDIANLQWQMSRAIRMNSHLLNLQMDAIADAVDQETIGASPEAQIALAFQNLVETSTALSTLDRHLAHLRRQHKYLRDELTRLQSLRIGHSGSGANATDSDFFNKLQNEPTGEQLPQNQQAAAPPEAPLASPPSPPSGPATPRTEPPASATGPVPGTHSAQQRSEPAGCVRC